MIYCVFEQLQVSLWLGWTESLAFLAVRSFLGLLLRETKRNIAREDSQPGSSAVSRLTTWPRMLAECHLGIPALKLARADQRVLVSLLRGSLALPKSY